MSIATELWHELWISQVTQDDVSLSDARALVNAALEAAAQKCDAWQGTDCKQHDENPCCHARTASAIAAAIRAMKEMP